MEIYKRTERDIWITEKGPNVYVFLKKKIEAILDERYLATNSSAIYRKVDRHPV